MNSCAFKNVMNVLIFYQNTANFISFKTTHQSAVLYSTQKMVLVAGGTLKIKDITEDDAGTYTCIADNGNETAEAQADLTVQGI